MLLFTAFGPTLRWYESFLATRIASLVLIRTIISVMVPVTASLAALLSWFGLTSLLYFLDRGFARLCGLHCCGQPSFLCYTLKPTCSINWVLEIFNSLVIWCIFVASPLTLVTKAVLRASCNINGWNSHRADWVLNRFANFRRVSSCCCVAVKNRWHLATRKLVSLYAFSMSQEENSDLAPYLPFEVVCINLAAFQMVQAPTHPGKLVCVSPLEYLPWSDNSRNELCAQAVLCFQGPTSTVTTSLPLRLPLWCLWYFTSTPKLFQRIRARSPSPRTKQLKG